MERQLRNWFVGDEWKGRSRKIFLDRDKINAG